MENSASARRSMFSGLSSKWSSLPFQKRLLNPTLNRPVWMRAEVVETAEDSTVSGTIVGIRFVLLLRIAPRLVASSNVPRDSAFFQHYHSEGGGEERQTSRLHSYNCACLARALAILGETTIWQ